MIPRANGACSCVIFDFGGVISHPQQPQFFTDLGSRLRLAPDVLREAYRHYRSEYDRGTLDGPAYWERVLLRAQVRKPEVGADELIKLDTASWTSVDPGVLEVIETLAAQGYKLGVLSNMPLEMGRAIRRDHAWLERRFDAVTFSCEIGAIKPEPAIYAHALESLGVRAGNCLFVDDTEVNVRAAEQAGMAALHFRSAGDIELALVRAPIAGRGQQPG